MRILALLTFPAIVLGGLFDLPSVSGQVAPERPVVRQPVRPGGVAATAPDPNLSDDEALKKAGLSSTDGAKLLDYLKQRTLSDKDQSKIEGIIARFGADDFDDRVKATEEIEAFGPAAVGPLKKAEARRDSDPEVAYRARLALKKLETVPHSAVASAAVRAVVKLKPEGAAAALIGFLPLADSEAVADVIREALVALAVRDGKADPAIVAALADPSPLRRSAAYIALIEGGDEKERIRVKDAYPKLREAVLRDADAEAKFAGLWSLALVTREKEYVAALIDLVPKLGRGRIWQLEELLLLLAGTHPKDGRFLKSPESLNKARDAWLAWWKEKGEKLDFVKFEYKPRVHGFTDIIEMDYRGYGQGRVVSIGPDLKEKWRITNVNNPTDVKVTAAGRIWVVESNNNQIIERDTKGTVITRRNAFQQPLNIDLLPDGGMVVTCRNQVLEWDKDGKQNWALQRPNYDIMAGHRMPNGDTLVLTNMFQGANSFRIDSKGKDANKNFTFGRVQQLQAFDVIDDDRVLVCEFDKVAEYDLKSGKQVWKHACPQNSASCCQRLPNGNTLICLMNQNQLIEVDPSGEVVWEYQSKDGLRVGRAFRR